MTIERATPNLDDLIARYVAGEPVKRLAEEAGMTRKTLKNRLLAAGVTIRGRGSESVKLAVATMPAEQRANVADAHRRAGETRRGRTASPELLAAMAAGRAESTRWITDDEATVMGWLAERGETQAVAQVAVGAYNIDIGLPGHIAVEIQRADTVAHSRQRRRMLHRIEELREAGWHVVLVMWFPSLITLTTAVADEIVATAHVLRRDPAAAREYRVIWGDGKYLSRGDHHLDELARIWPTRGTHRLRPTDEH